MSDERFPKSERLRKKFDYQRTEKNKTKRFVTKHLIILSAANSLDYTRIGITVSKRVGTAVKRNRIKRLLREIYRRNKDIFKWGYDYILIARAQDKTATYNELYQEISKALGSNT